MQLSAHVLGGIEFHVDDQAVAVGGPRQRRLLGALLIRRGEVVPTSRLIEAVWTGAPPAAAERTFRSYVARLRRAFDDAGIDGADIIDTGPSGYSICGEIELDAASFEADLDIARRQLDLGDVDAAQRHVERALEAWSGNAFGEFADEEWAIAEAVRLEELRWVARELGVDIDIERGNLDAAIADALRLTEQQPLRERPHRLLMLAYYRRGRQMEALRVGREYGDRLRDETGLDPSGEFTDLETRVFSSDLSLDAQIATRTIRGYRLGDVLVATDHSVTYRANRAEHPGQLALTIVSMDIADDATFVRDFEHEARRRASILHPGLAPWLDHWREPGSAYVVVRLPSGGLLRDRLTTSEPWAIESARRLVRDVGDALSALHRSAIAFGELNVDDIWFEGDRPLLVGPIVGIGATTARDDVVSFARLVRDAFARGGAPSELTDAQIDRLDRLMAAVSDRGEPQIAPLVDEILWLLGDGPRPCTPAGEVMNPYRGLEPFHERHARWFFGRSNATEELDIELRRSAFVTVVGPSGSGKSSLVRAGLVPRTRADGWLTTVMQPGSHPINELALALAAVATAEVPLADDPTSVVAAINGVVSGEQQLLLVVDQFEELWTVAEPTQRDALLSGLELLAASEGQQVHIVATLRADYLGHALSHPAIGALVRDHTTLLAPMTTAELAEAILEPAQVVGVTVEADLAAAIVVDAGRSEGSLPLVQFALMELFERRTADVMTLRAYRQIGGLGGVVSRRAEDIFQRLSDEEQAAAEVALTRLVSVDSVGDPTRRRVPSAELTEAAATVVAAFGDGRLLTFDRDRSTREQTVEIAHESLAREWSRLRDWLDADQESLAVLRRLSAATRSWAATGRRSGGRGTPDPCPPPRRRHGRPRS